MPFWTSPLPFFALVRSFVRSFESQSFPLPTWSVLLLLIFRYNFEDLILQFGKRPKPHTALHYTHELITTFGLIHTLNSDTNQLEAELCGTTSFRDHRIPPPRPPPRPPSSSTTITSTPDYDSFTVRSFVRSFVRQLRLPLTAYQTYRALRQFN